MRQRRLKVGGEGIYHCMTRTVNGERLFGRREKEVLRRMLARVADFSGVDVLTYCVMENHFHVLVRVREAGPDVSDEELLRRYAALYPEPTPHRPASLEVLARRLRAGGEPAEELRSALLARMGDVSQFMKTLKERFAIWFNHNHSRYGPLWSDRFKSVLVERNSGALATMAAYIDLNPVRAGLVADPKDYRFCGYGEAVGGSAEAVRGLAFVLGGGAVPEDVSRALGDYRMVLFGKGSEERDGMVALSREKAAKVVAEGGELPWHTLLRCRVRYFTEGRVLGSAEFASLHCGDAALAHGRRRPLRKKRVPGDGGAGLFVAGSTRGAAIR